MPIVTALLAALLAPPAAPPDLLSHAALEERLRAVTAANPERARLTAIGRSREGRPIFALRLTSGAGEPPAGRPAILVVANADGPEVFSSGVALFLAESIASGAGDARIDGFLDRATLLVVPRANPDAAEARFATPLAEVEATGRGVDDDRDRREGEDPPEDVDGDGVVAWMRWPDPKGEWIEDPADPRALVRADAAKGERGRYRLSVEGRDRDRDERVAEDAEKNAIVNRNFPHGWTEHADDAGRYPLDEPEGKALADFVIAHPEIALVLAYGALDTLVEKPKSVKEDAPPQKRVPQPGVIEPDANVLAEIGRRYAEITGQKTKGRRADDGGSFPAWTYQHRSILTLAATLWDVPLDPDAKKPPPVPEGESPKEAPQKPKEKDEPKPSDDAKRLRWIDSSGESWRFRPWTPFEHPELGAVEIGGFAPYARVEPPDAERAGIASKQLDFVLSLGDVLARVEIASATAKDLGGGLFEIEAAIENEGLVPAPTSSGRRTRVPRPIAVRLALPDGASLVAGNALELVRELGGTGARREFRWLVRGPSADGIAVSIDSDYAGKSEARVEVVR